MANLASNISESQYPDWVRRSNANALRTQSQGFQATDAGTRSVNTNTDIALREMTLKEQQAAQKNAALAAIAGQLQSTTGYSPAPGGAPAPGGGTAPGMAPAGTAPVQSPEELAAENASYGRAKERTGLAMQGALKGLRGVMASRGIGGSGIEASETGKVFSGGLGELADTDRQMAEQGATRAFTAGQAGLDRAEKAREYDQDAQARRLSQLISAYGSMY